MVLPFQNKNVEPARYKKKMNGIMFSFQKKKNVEAETYISKSNLVAAQQSMLMHVLHMIHFSF